MNARAYTLAALAGLAAPFLVPSYYVTLLDYVGVYGLVAIGLAWLTGVAGVVSFGQAALAGIAAYATAWLTTTTGLGAWAGLAFALPVTLAVALVLGLVTLRLKGHLLSLSTLAWGLAIAYAFGNIDALGSFTGLAGVPPIRLGPLSLGDNSRLYYLILTLVAAAIGLLNNLFDSRTGRALRALRGGTQLVESVGVDPFGARLTAFLIAAGLAALSGWLYAHLARFVSPTPFDARMGVEYLMMAMVGGASPLGGLIGAAFVTGLKDAIQDLLPRFLPDGGAPFEIVVFSVLFILFLQRARDGLAPWLASLLPRPATPPSSAPPLPRRALPAAGSPLLALDHVSKRFAGLVAVNELSFEVRSGEIVALIGPNGAGKSTTFGLLTGALPLSAGAVQFQGRKISGLPAFRIARLGVARTFQHVRLRPRMSVIDNVLMGAHARLKAGVLAGALRLDRAEAASARSSALAALARVGLAERAEDLAGALPLGAQRLVEVARALIADPLLIALDEPAAGLRRPEKLALAETLRGLRAEGLALLVVEHDMAFVMSLADRLVVMDFGAKIADGPPAAARAEPRVREAYLGGAP